MTGNEPTVLHQNLVFLFLAPAELMWLQSEHKWTLYKPLTPHLVFYPGGGSYFAA